MDFTNPSHLAPRLLFIVSVLYGSRVAAAGQPRTAYACEGSRVTIICPLRHYIQVIRANYGRFSASVCNKRGISEGLNLQCMSTRSLNVVSDRCDRRLICRIHADNRLFGDPCRDTPKYLEVHYMCRSVDQPIVPVKTRPTTQSTTTSPSPSTSYTSPYPTTTQSSSSTSVSSTTELKSTTSTTTTTTTTTKVPDTTSTVAITTPTTTQGKVEPPDPIKPLPKKVCKAVRERDVEWPETESGRMVKRPCPNDKHNSAYWVCGMEPVDWLGKPDLSHCESDWMRDLDVQLDQGIPVEEAAEQLEKKVKEVKGHKKKIYGGELRQTLTVMSKVVMNVEKQTKNVTIKEAVKKADKTNEAIVHIANELLSSDQRDSWHDLPAEGQKQAAEEMINAVEDSAFQVAHTITVPNSITKINVNIMLEVNVVDTTSKEMKDVVFPPKKAREHEGWKHTTDQIKIPATSIKQYDDNGLAKMVFTTYNNLNEYLNPAVTDKSYQDPAATVKSYQAGQSEGKADIAQQNVIEVNDIDTQEEEQKKFAGEVEAIVNSNVISASINQHKESIPLLEPVVFSLQHKQREGVENPTCSYWNFTGKEKEGSWSDMGCWVVSTTQTQTVCACDHLTNFAVLMDVTGTKLESHHEVSLQVITYAGCLISLICLLLSWLTFQFFKNLQCDRNTIHKNLVFCLFVAEIIFLPGIVQYDKPVLCSVIAGFLHYFFLAAFCWMCLEGVQLYVMLIEVFEAERSRVKYYYLASYGFPALLVGAAAAVDYESYGTDRHCWLRADNGFVWFFVAPVIAIITVNIVMLSIAIYIMCKHAGNAAAAKAKDKSRLRNMSSWIKGAVVLVALLGLTWAFGLLYVNEHTVVMAYVFTVLNSLQGLFIFVFHCLMNEKVQKEYKRCARHSSCLPSCIRVKYGGASVYRDSSTPPQSSTSGNYFQKLLSGRRRKKSSSTTLPNSSTSSKWKYMNVQNSSMSSGRNSYPSSNRPMSGLSSEPENEYLQPVKIEISEPNEYSAINGDLSMIDASVVDTEFLSEYCRDGLGCVGREEKPSTSTDKNVVAESESSDADLRMVTEKEKYLNEFDRLTEQNCPSLKQHDDSSEKILNRVSSESLNSSSLNDLNKNYDTLKGSKPSLHKSIPTINYKPNLLDEPSDDKQHEPKSTAHGSLPNLEKDSKKHASVSSEEDSNRESVILHSMPNLCTDNSSDKDAAESVKKARSAGSDNGLIAVASGGEDVIEL